MQRLQRLIGVLLVVFITQHPANAGAGPASDVVSGFQDGLVDVMKNAKELGVSGRYERLEPLIKNTFNLPLMAGLSAGPYWQAASDGQRQRLVSAFTRMSVATLATLFDGYSGESFEQVGERSGPQDIVFVDTELKVPGRQEPVKLSYVARESAGRWRLIDVIVDGGISELKVRISEYSQTLRNSGIEALIDLLNRKADELLS